VRISPVIPVYDIQQSVEEAMPFRFEARIRYDGVVAGYESEGDVAVIGSLRGISTLFMQMG
jgi:hypothetical protein